MSIVVKYLESDKELYRRYPQQNKPQDVYLELDPETEHMGLDWNGEIGNAVPFPVWHRRRYRFDIPGALLMALGNDLLKEALPLGERVIAGYSTDWDGNNYVGHLDDDGQDAYEALESLCSDIDPDTDCLCVCDAGEWYQGTYQEMCEAVAGKTDEELEALSEEHEEEAEEEGYYIEGTVEYLLKTRDEQEESHE